MSVFIAGGGIVAEHFSVTNSLTHVMTNNSAFIVIKGKPYIATLTMESGYNVLSVVVTMDGVDVTTSVYSNGIINIETVTGDIVITAVAKHVDFKTWYINEQPSITTLEATINFTSNKKQYNKFSIVNLVVAKGIYYYRGSNGDNVYSGSMGFGQWQDENFRTVVFDTEPTEQLRTWLEANATPL